MGKAKEGLEDSMGKDEAGPSLNRIKGYVPQKGNRETRPYLSNTDGVG